jgi:CheY-like chemotaxis protein
MSRADAHGPIVLVVEDDFLIRMNAAQMIEDASFIVVEAANSDEALAISRSAWTLPLCLRISRCPTRWTA